MLFIVFFFKERKCKVKHRECNYDILRALSMIAVIVIHVSAAWINSYEKLIDSKNIKNSLDPFFALELMLFQDLLFLVLLCYLVLLYLGTVKQRITVDFIAQEYRKLVSLLLYSVFYMFFLDLLS